ncbi:MAG TPA: ThuA domain-containing protein [Vicinamibacterales bacterium]|nr:ThuA domain-containing protein [Vicinamibacterales bacterium]
MRGVLLAAFLAPAVLIAADQGDWPMHDHDAGGTRFSPLTQITPANVSTLQPAWSFDTGVTGIQVTPLVVGGMMYVTAGKDIIALEPETGKVLWRFTAPANVSRRGVAYWPGDARTPARLFSGAGDKMIAVNAESGKLENGFGDGGSVDLKASVRGDVDGGFSLVSPPAVYKNIVITGGNNGEQSPSYGLYGDIRGWDARTGKLLWSFHTVPRAGEPGADTWENDSWKNRSGTNMWSFFTVDDQRGIVYVPLGAPTSDYYGADRHGKNLYGNSLVALDATTGALKWFQQLVHHDLWDFDIPAAPTLVDVKRNGRTIPAVVVVTKMSLLFMFDRVTGEPIFGMEERPVPKSNVPGEASWPTQPFPTKPAPLGRITFDPAKDFNALTPEIQAYCKDLWDKSGMYTNGPYTPPGTEGTMLTFPSTIGGGNWNGTAYDPSLGLVFTNVMNLGQVAKMVQGTDRSGNAGWVRRSPWGGAVGRFWNPETKVPCSAPPFGELIAVNVNTGDIAWHVPIGFIPALKDKGLTNTGGLGLGGGIATASGLIFIGATTDGHFRAFESKTGKQLWDTTLDAPSHSVPMTFMGKDRRQYVVVAAGGGGYLQSPAGSKIVAFALGTQQSAISNQHVKKHVLAWGDVRNGYQHESISHAFATIERLGRESGLYDTTFRTDSQPITKRDITFKTGTGIATGEQFLAHNLNYYDAIFFFGVREIGLTPQQRADLLSFVRDDGKGFVTAHSGATAFFSWPEFGKMLGGRFDEHPWGITDATVVVDDPSFPAMKNFPSGTVFHDEHYQLKDFSRSDVHVLAHLDASKLDLTAPLVHRTDKDFPVAWTKNFGKGRVFYSTLGHEDTSWDNPAIQQMYFEAIKWALRIDTPAAAPTMTTGLPEAKGKTAVLKMCSDCHGLETAITPRHSRTEWQQTVESMRERGAPGTDEDSRAAIDYLAKYFGR